MHLTSHPWSGSVLGCPPVRQCQFRRFLSILRASAAKTSIKYSTIFFLFRSDLAGKNDIEEAECMMIVLTMEDLVTPMFDCYHHIRQDLYPENDESRIVS